MRNIGRRVAILGMFWRRLTSTFVKQIDRL